MVNPVCCDGVPDSQHGAATCKGADSAAHPGHSLVAYCDTSALPCLVRFADLVKAFDRIIHEDVPGWPTGAPHPVAYLATLGLSHAQETWIAEQVARNGCLPARWGVYPWVLRLLMDVHPASWFPYGDVDTATATLARGPQGREGGDTVCDVTFSLAMALIRDALLSSGIMLCLRPGDAAFWQQGGVPDPGADAAGDVPVVDAAFVDDECFMLTAKDSALLDASIDTMLDTVCSAYEILNLTVNWKAGKSECFLTYRGKGATTRLQRRRILPGGGLAVAVPRREVQLLVVSCYKHLGGVISAGGTLGAAAQHLRGQAAQSYAPLACKIFGSPVVSAQLKFHLMQSLILSRLMHNVHILVPTRRFFMLLNRVYMRALPRIGGTPRYGPPTLTTRCAQGCGSRASTAWRCAHACAPCAG